MNDGTHGGNGKVGLVGQARRVWRMFWSPSLRFSFGFLMLSGIVIGIVGWGGFHWALELTNTETFCVTCHEMEQNNYREFAGTIHDANPSGVRATCPDCHVPRDWYHKVVRKIQASNELLHHFMGSIDTREKFEANRLRLATNVWTAMKNTDSRECRNCHDFQAMDVTMQGRRARQRHLEAEDQGMTCIDCHKGIAHKLPAGAFTAEQELSETWNAVK